MIGRLKGIADFVGENIAIIDVAGVGYEVHASSRTLAALQPSEAVALIIETHVREDHIHLYGFANENEREWFRILNTVKGVGTKMALAILSVYSPEELITAILAKDKAAFTRISGVGPKLAERLLTELKSKAGSVGDIAVAVSSGAVSVGATTEAKSDIADAISALTQLGYSRTDAYTSVQKAASQNKEASVQELVTAGLKELSAVAIS